LPRLAGALLVVVALLAACGGGTAADAPSGVVRTALDKLAAKDLAGLQTLACAGQEDMIRDQLGLAGAVGSGLLEGLDTQALMDAVQMDVSGLTVGDATVDGDTAQVPVSGDLKVTFDADAMRPILRQLFEKQGATMTDAQLDALLSTLESYGQSVPVTESIRLVRESGAWKICQQTIASPAPS
jgi:hypothetical protein